MPHIIFPSGDDEVNCSDAVQAHKQDVERTMPGTAAVEHSAGLTRAVHAPPPTQRFPLSTLATAALADHCMHEINLYHQGKYQGDAYCVELLRRATLQDDQDAWQAVRQCLSETVLRWLDRHPQRETACRLDTAEHYVTQAFERFSQATVQQQVAFSTLADALFSLRAYLNSVLLDTLRASSRSRGILVPRRNEAEQPESTSSEQSNVWDMLRNMLPNVREQRLAYLLFHCGLRPKDIVRTYPQEFQDVEEISSLRRGLIQRLLDSEDQLGWSRDAAWK